MSARISAAAILWICHCGIAQVEVCRPILKVQTGHSLTQAIWDRHSLIFIGELHWNCLVAMALRMGLGGYLSLSFPTCDIAIIHSSPTTVSLTSLRRVYDQSCPLNLLRPPHIPTLCPSSMLPWISTDERRRKTWPRTPFFPPYNPAVPPKLSSPSFETKFPGLAIPRIPMTDSQNGSPRL